MTRSERLPDDLEGRAFGPADARRAGVGENRLRRKDLHRPFHGVRVATPPTNLLERCLAYGPRLKPGQFFSHTTAALLHGRSLPLGFEDEPDVHVAALLPADAPHARNVRGHRLLESLEPVQRSGLPVAHEADVLWQLAGMLAFEDLVVVADELLNDTDLPEAHARRVLLDRAAAARRVGSAKLVRAVDASRRGARSPTETRVRLVLDAARIPEAELNAPIQESGTGRYLGSPDFVWRAQRIVLEYDGDGHRVDKRQFRRDIIRYDDLVADGWRVLRATGDDLTAEGRKALVRRVARAFPPA
ncbi:DUF559 domain-containing protein [uncultured Amnibacterium sp.]|uniref:DUF559 domain-containing protein n=1 Tax=uncultured Amnibacterium sp. TaxID=1631851 RepID=UPI0035CACB23